MLRKKGLIRNVMIVIAVLFSLPSFSTKEVRAAESVSYYFQNVKPSIGSGIKTYQQKVINSGGSAVTYSIGTCVGTATADIDSSTGKLSNIKGNGVIQVIAKSGNLTADYVLTIAYSLKVWNFYSTTLTPTPNGRLGVSPIGIGDATEETDKGNIDSNFWSYKYKINQYQNGVLISQTAPLFAYKNKVDGDNALIIQETAGLQFVCKKERFGVRNNATVKQKRNIEFGSTGSMLIIPKLKKGQFIKIWCEPYAGSNSLGGGTGSTFKATNVLDLDGNSIDKAFSITGLTSEWTKLFKDKFYGSSCFQVKADGDVTFELADNGWNDIYQIEVSDQLNTDFRVAVHYSNLKGNLVSSQNGNNTVLAGNSLWISGFPQETLSMDAISPETELVEGRDLVDMKSVPSRQYTLQKITPKKGSYGNVLVRQKIISYSEGGTKYVLNKNEAWLAVGDLTQKIYPYTWDFTSYNSNWDNQNGNTNGTVLTRSDEKAYGTWTSSTGHHIYNDKPIFANGSQLTLKNSADVIEPIKETEGLGIVIPTKKLADKDYAINVGKSASDTEYSLQVNQEDGIKVPQVNAGMYIFVSSDKKPTLKHSEGSNKIASVEANKFQLQNGIYAYKVSELGDVTITGVNKIFRIAVTNQIKSFNADGRTTDSRAVAIDYSETQKYTKDKLTAYSVYEDAANSYLTTKGDVSVISLSEVKVADKNTGVVLWNNPENNVYGSTISTMDVPLFVPAMNISATSPWGNSPLQPNVEEKSMPASDNSTVYYVYTNKFFTSSNPNYQTGNQYLFYKVKHTGTLAANKAYLKLNKNVVGMAKQSILLQFSDNATTGISHTAITDKKEHERYSLSGLKLNGTPKPGEIYIQGGKKIIAK